MEATIFKVNGFIDSSLNLKYWELVTKETSFALRLYMFDGMSKARIISYNGALTAQSNVEITPVTTYQFGNDTLYEYMISRDSSDVFVEINVPATCTKILVEDVEWLHLNMGSTNTLLSFDNVLFHTSKNAVATPSTDSEYTTKFLNQLGYNDPDRAVSVDELFDFLPHYNSLSLNKQNIIGDISDIANYIKVDQPCKGNYSQYSYIRIYVANCGNIYGSTRDALNAIKTRRAAKWAAQFYVNGTSVTIDDGESTSQCCCLCDENGDFTFYSSVGDLDSAIPAND